MERDEEEREEKGSWLGGTGSYGRRGGVLMLARQNFGRRMFWGRARALIGRRRAAVIGHRAASRPAHTASTYSNPIAARPWQLTAAWLQTCLHCSHFACHGLFAGTDGGTGTSGVGDISQPTRYPRQPMTSRAGKPRSF
jgi:hypothetical protein